MNTNVNIKIGSRIVITLLIVSLIACYLPTKAQADDWIDEIGEYYTLYDSNDNELTKLALQMFVDDEYISSDNKHYKVTGVNDGRLRAEAEYLGDIDLPQFEPIKTSSNVNEIISANAEVKGNILIYCTHSDESYVPTDGTESNEQGQGGIYDVAQTFKESCEQQGVPAVLDKTSHVPHDAGAYRRSRETAVAMMKSNQPVAAIFDMHRDAIPAAEYQTEVNGEPASLVRIVIGKRNQNSAVNRELAETIKAVADKSYPGLIKDIYIGKGNYNQELSPRSLLFECGTHESNKEEVQKSMGYLGEVATIALFGGKIQDNAQQQEQGEQQATDEQQPEDGQQAEDEQQEGEDKTTTGYEQPPKNGGNGGEQQPAQEYQVEPMSQQETKGAGKGILWLLVVLAVGAGAFIFVSMGGKERKARLKGFFSREFNEFKKK